jgi:PAS domain S-box-containing protein
LKRNKAKTLRTRKEDPEEANYVIFKHDLKGKFTFLNKTGELISGYSRGEACRMNVTQLLAPELVEVMRDRPVASTREVLGRVYEIDIIAKDGRRVLLEVSTETVLRNGRPIEIQGIAVPSVLREARQ